MSDISRIYYNKLVRDNIPDKITSKGEQCEVRQIIDVQEFQQELFKKIREEATALSMARTKKDFLGEYSDLMAVFEAIIEQLEITPEEILAAREENNLKKGGYKHQHFLIWSEDTDYQSNETPQGISN